MAYDALLRVVAEEAAHEVERIREVARREAGRIVDEARAAASTAREAVVAREREAGAARLRAARERLVLTRERALLAEQRRLLAAVEAEVRGRLAAAGGTALDARLLAALVPELPAGPLEVEVDPGAAAAAREALVRLAPAAAARARFREVEAPRGGVAVRGGRLVLDATLPARLERAWPALELELARLLFGEHPAPPAGEPGAVPG
ncbi:MAG: hypothetical protein QM704_15920 [Anaeromyxobacteraceae bacterium]